MKFLGNILGHNGAPLAINGAPITCASAGTDTSDATISSNSQLLYPYTSYGNGIKYTGSIQSQAAQTIYPSTSDQTISSGVYLSGIQTVKGVLLTNLSAGNIKKDVVVKVGDSADDDRITSITGTYEGGGGVQTAAVIVNGGDIYYTDANMTYQQASGILAADVPIGTLVVTSGPGAYPSDPVGVTQILSFGTARYVYVVTG